MLLKEMTLKNFRQFKDEEKIIFSTKEDANITLILGDNTSGKTTILQGLLWCLYGRARFKTRDQLFNEQNAAEMSIGSMEDVMIKLTILHRGSEYYITRKQTARAEHSGVRLIGNSRLTINQKTEDGQTITIKPIDLEAVITEILPQELSDYFFYDTERFGNITEKDDVSSSVKGLLGLTVLENAIDHLGRTTRSRTVLGKLNNELNIEGSKEIQEISQVTEQLDQEIEDIKLRLENEKNELIEHQKNKEAEESKLRELKPAMALQKEKDEYIRRRKRSEAVLNKARKDYLTNFQGNALRFFVQPLISRVDEFLAQADVQDEGIHGLDSNSIKDIVDRGYCICGTKLEEGSKHLKTVEETLENVPPQSLGVMISNLQNMLKTFGDPGKDYYTNMESRHKDVISSNLELGNINHHISIMDDKIQGVEEAHTIQSRIKDLEGRISRSNQRQGEFKNTIKYKEVELLNQKSKYNRLVEVDDKNREILTLIRYGEEIAKWFQDNYDEKSLEIREELEEKVNKYFQEIYHGDRIVSIDDSYRVVLYSGDEELVTDESAGLETVKNFSFIAGLVDLAKQRIEKEDKVKQDDIDFDMGEDYPLVLDAPFSHVDETHVVNIAKVLPSVAGQLVLIVMAKDWNYAAEELTNRVGKTYHLIKKSEVHTVIREV